MRRHNLGRLARIVHVSGPTSRSDLAAITGLNRSTIGALATELAQAGLVRETTPVGRGVGRPSIGVAPDGARVVALAIDLGVERTVAALVGFGGGVLVRREVHHRRRRSSPSEVLDRVRQLGGEVLAERDADALCVGVGIAVPGVIRHSDGLVRFAPNLGWQNVPFAHQVAGVLQTALPIVVGNDADLGAIAEHLRGAAAGLTNVVYISGEVGVGGGIILDGEPMVGAGGYGGEIGHMVVNPGGRACRCGRRGCWETEIGEEAVLAALGGTLGDDVDAALSRLRERSDGDAPELAGVGEWLGIGLGNLVNVFNPEMVVFGGLLRQMLPLTEGHLRAHLDSALAAPREQVRLAEAALGRDSALLGAGEAVFAPLLDDPLGVLTRSRAALLA